MDAVAGVASVTQLAAYGHCAAKYLLRLYRTARDALSLVKCQQEDIFVLLQVIYRLNSDNSSLDSDLLLPVLIRIIDTAQTLFNWFNEPGVLGIKWMLVKRRSQIDDALKTLKQKSDLLGLYLVERNHAILLRLETSLNKEPRNIAGSIENMGPHTSRKVREKKPEAINSAQSDRSSTSQSQAVVLYSDMDRNQRQHLNQQQQGSRSEQQQSSSANQSNDQKPQERQRATSSFTMHGNKLDDSSMIIGNGWQDRCRGVHIDAWDNKGTNKSTYNAFNANDYKRA